MSFTYTQWKDKGQAIWEEKLLRKVSLLVMCVWATGATDARTSSRIITIMLSTQKGVAMNSYTEGKYNAARHYGLLRLFDAQEILDCGFCNSPDQMQEHPHFFCKYYQLFPIRTRQFLRDLSPSVKRAKDKKVRQADRNLYITIDGNRHKVDKKMRGRTRRKVWQ